MTTKFYSKNPSEAKSPLEVLYLPLALVVFCVMCYFWNATQDDSYITFRYAEHFLSGHGLVWNYGVRLEGYTNFLWLILVAFFKTLGIPYLYSAKALGVLASCGTIAVTYLLVKRFASAPFSGLIALCVGLLLAGNYSLAYWSMSGMETALFTFLVISALYAYLNRSWLLAPILALAILTRPEGVILAGFFPVYSLLFDRHKPKFELICIAIAGLLLVPLVVFKLVYFQQLLPNPFYAKTNWDFTQLKAGAEYLWTFCQQFGVFGLLLVAPAILWKNMSPPFRMLYVFGIVYTLYIVFVGGDVLHANRFFLPILSALYVPFIAAFFTHFQNRRWPIVIAVTVLALQSALPYENLRASYTAEDGLNKQSRFVAEYMQQVDTSDFVVAASTIGQTGFVLINHKIIDMVGLTDSVIARHPQTPIENLATTWRERKYNVEYVLNQAPDYFLFGAATKPSSPGEKALFLYPAFLNNYRTLGFYWPKVESMVGIYKKMNDSLGEIKRVYPAEFVNYYHDALTQMGYGDFAKALYYLDSARQLGPKDPPYLELMYHASNCLARLNMNQQSFNIIEQIVGLDSNMFSAHQARYLSLYQYPEYKDRALESREQIKRLAPWELPRLDSLVNYKPENQ